MSDLFLLLTGSGIVLAIMGMVLAYVAGAMRDPQEEGPRVWRMVFVAGAIVVVGLLVLLAVGVSLGP